ncbi:MAG: prohibitin family protein [Chromatiales bacterium]
MNPKLLRGILRSQVPPEDAAKGHPMLRIALIALIVIVVVFVLNPFVIVGPGQRGVLLKLGAVQDKVLGEGFHFRIPVVQSIVKMDVRIQKEQTESDASSKDLQDTHSTIAVNFHVDPPRVNWVYQNLKDEYTQRVIDPTVQEVVKAVTARYTAIDLITQREKVRQEIKGILHERLSQYSIVVDDFAIVNFRFSPQFIQAIESKQTAEQLALKASRDLDRIKVEAEQKLTQARAEAESLRLQKEVITPELVELRKIEAQLKAIEKWNGLMPQVTGGAMPFINLAPPSQQ